MLDETAPAQIREYKTLSFKAGDTDGLADDQFQGYLSTFNNIDDGCDVIAPGAFVGTIPDFLTDGVVCWQHDWMTPIGRWLEAREDSYGLFVKGQISQTTAGKDALILLRDRVITKMSIGYQVLGYRMLSDDEGVAMFGQAAYDAAMHGLPWYQDGIRLLTSVKLFEGSPVTVPMNPKAVITGVKDGLLAGLSHDAHFAAVLAAVGGYEARVKALADLRRKEGRTLSAANSDKLRSMRDSLAGHMDTLQALLDASAPADDGKAAAPTPAGIDPIRHELLRFRRMQANLNGVL